MFMYPLTDFDADKELDKIVARDKKNKFFQNLKDTCTSKVTKITQLLDLNI